jgi:hypothetical protein
MSLHRKIDWTSAMRDIRNDRAVPAAPGFLAARSMEIACLDRLAIMRAAVAQARLQKAKGSKAPWSQLMGTALRFVWLHAKQQRAFAVN